MLRLTEYDSEVVDCPNCAGKGRVPCPPRPHPSGHGHMAGIETGCPVPCPGCRGAKKIRQPVKERGVIRHEEAML